MEDGKTKGKERDKGKEEGGRGEMEGGNERGKGRTGNKEEDRRRENKWGKMEIK